MLSCLSKLTLSQKAYNTQGSDSPSSHSVEEREFRPGISLIPTEDLIQINPQYDDLRAVDPLAEYPWSGGLDPIAPEEEDIPVPCGFTEVLRIMAMSESEQMDTLILSWNPILTQSSPKQPTYSSS